MTNNKQAVVDALRNLVAIERDRQLGYHPDELHMDPTDAIRDGMDALEMLGDDPDQVVWPEDQKKLDL